MNEAMFTKTFSHPDYPELQVIFEAYDEDQDPTTHFDDERDIDFAYEGGSHWFVASVKVQLIGTSLLGIDYLGCCSYDSYESFMNDEYFKDMIDEATQDLITDLNQTTDKINAFSEHFNKAY